MAHNQRVPMNHDFKILTDLRYRYGGCRGFLRHRKCFWIEERVFRKIVKRELV